MTSIMEETTNKIHNMYKDLSYLDQYGGSVILLFLMILVLFIVFAYFYVMKNIQPIKDNWNLERCNPKVLPFAGFINKPDDKSISEFTNENFSYCMQNILISITGYIVEPVMYVTSNLNQVFSEISSSIQSIRGLFTNVRTYFATVSEEIMGRVLNITTPLIQIIITFVDTLEKTIGILTAGLYTSLGTYYALKSFLGAVMKMLIIILIVLGAIIIGLWLVPFTWGAAIAYTTVFLSISIVLSVMIAFFSQVLQITPDMSLPSAPSKPNLCFDKDIMLKMDMKETSQNQKNIYKKISEIKAGDVLEKSGKVTAVLKLDARSVKMFEVNGVIVSGGHQVNYCGLWVPVSLHPKRKLVADYDEPYIYCLNTTSKRIFIEDMEFLDWDEVLEDELLQLKQFCKNKIDENHNDKGFIHKYFDVGYKGLSNVTLKTGEKRRIKDVEIGDILKNGGKVYGVIEIVDNSYQAYQDIFPRKRDTIYNLLVDVGSFDIENVIYKDYNSCVDFFLTKDKKNNLHVYV